MNSVLEQHKKKIEEVLAAAGQSDLELIDALIQIKQLLDPEDRIKHLKKRFDFWTFELETHDLKSLSPRDKLIFLRDFVFQQKSKIMKQSLAPQILRGLVLQNLAFLSDLQMNFILLGENLALKTNIDGLSSYISLGENGKILNSQEVLDYIFEKGHTKKIELSELIMAYLEDLQSYIDEKTSSQQMMRVYEILLTLRKSDPSTLLRRAYLFKELGLISEAIADIKRFLNIQAQPSTSAPVQGPISNSPEI